MSILQLHFPAKKRKCVHTPLHGSDRLFATFRENSRAQCMPVTMQHFLYFLCDPHGHGPFRPTSASEWDVRITLSKRYLGYLKSSSLFESSPLPACKGNSSINGKDRLRSTLSAFGVSSEYQYLLRLLVFVHRDVCVQLHAPRPCLSVFLI